MLYIPGATIFLTFFKNLLQSLLPQLKRSVVNLCTLKAYAKYFYPILLSPVLFFFGCSACAQKPDTIMPNIPPPPTMQQIMKDWGPNDSLKVSAIWYGSDYADFHMIPYTQEEDIWLSNLSLAKLAKVKAEHARLRTAVYVVYPLALEAGYTINQINKQLEGINNRHARKAIIKAREKDLKEKFADKVKNLSVYQGEVLMKLINRQTGNNCYELLKEYKGSFNTNMYQAAAWIYGGNLKQDYDIVNNKFDRQIEIFVKEIDGNWYNNPFRK